MKYPDQQRRCPHGWTDCKLCYNLKKCKSDLEIVIKASEISTRVINAEVAESVAKIKGTWFDEFAGMSERDRWREYEKYPTPNLHTITDPYKAMPGAFVPGGGSKSKGHKKPKRKIPEYMKILGM